MVRAGLKKKIGKCRYKTSKGNVYDTYESAKFNTIKLNKDRHLFLEPYYCEVCEKFHIGKANKVYSFPRYQHYSIIRLLFQSN